MRRLWLVLLALMLLLSACSLFGKGEVRDADDEEETADPDAPVLTKKDIALTVWTDPGGEGFIEQAAAVFNQKYPNIKINCEIVDPSEQLNRVWAESESGGCADLFILPHTDVRQLAEAQLILPARDQSKTKGAVFGACAQAATVNGVIYGYPVSAETVAMFYNKKLIHETEIPDTWDALIEFSKGFNGDGPIGFIMPVGSVYHNATFLLAMNNRPFGPNGDNGKVLNLNIFPAIEGMTVFQKLKGASGLSSEELTAAAAEELFASGKAAMCIAGPWSIARFMGSGVDFGVVPLPAFEEEGQGPSLAFSRVMAVSAYSEWADEASAFAAHLLTEEMQKLRVDLTGEMPSVDLQIRSPAYADGFIRQMTAAVAAPSIPEAAAYWNVFRETAVRIWDGGKVEEELSAAVASLRVTEPETETEEPEDE